MKRRANLKSKYNDKKILSKLIQNSYSFNEVIRKLGGFPHGNTRTKIKEKAEEFRIDISHFITKKQLTTKDLQENLF